MVGSDAARETAGVTTRLIVRYVRDHAGVGAVNDMLALAGETRPVEVIEDERTWSTYAQKVALFEAAAKVIGDPDVALHIGESVLRTQIGLPLRMVLWGLGSPAQLLRNIAKTGAKFSTAAVLEYVSGGRTSAVVTYRLLDGFEPNEQDCGYTIGLLSQAPALFGLAPAVVRHDECQVRGAPRCVYELSWDRRRRLFRDRSRLRRLERELQLMTAQVESLQLAAAEIVSAGDIEDTVERVAERVRTIIRVSGHLVAVRPLVGADPLVHADGVTADETGALLDSLAKQETRDAPGRLVLDIASATRRYGHIVAMSPGEDPFFPDERRMLAAYSALAATALDSAVSRETARVLSELGQSLADITSGDEVCQRIADALPRVVGSPVAAVAQWNEEQETLQFAGVHGFTPEAAEALRGVAIRPSDTPALIEQLEHPEPRLFRRDAEDPFINGVLATFDVDAAMTVPMVARGAVHGFVIAGWHRMPAGDFDDELVERMGGLAGQGATALQNARLLERTTHQALHDPLTGLPNRVLLDDRLQQAAARARREDTQIAVLLLDLDGFKTVNDSLGHRAGDAVLQEIARRISTVLRDADTAARLGGDEFVIVCESIADLEEAEGVGQRVEEVLARPIAVAGTCVTVGASVGVVTADSDADDLDDLLALADEAMYVTKRSRANRAPRIG